MTSTIKSMIPFVTVAFKSCPFLSHIIIPSKKIKASVIGIKIRALTIPDSWLRLKAYKVKQPYRYPLQSGLLSKQPRKNYLFFIVRSYFRIV